MLVGLLQGNAELLHVMVQVVDRIAEEHAKKKQVSHQQVQQAIKQEHETLVVERYALEEARKKVEHAKMEQVPHST